jgi:curved DNA-binding protein
MDSPNYYEFLQISPNAEAATIQRVYRFLAGRYHPDNPETGDTDKFVLLNCAFGYCPTRSGAPNTMPS